MNNFINICIVTFNRLEYTKKCIESIFAYADYPHVITVVDNNSTDGTRKYLNNLKSRELIKNLFCLDSNLGVAKASNIGWLCEPDAEYYLKLDNDVMIQKSPWLAPMVKTIEDIPVAGAVAYNFENKEYPPQEINGHHVIIKHGNLGGACILIPKRTEKLLGYWCEDYGVYGQEDLDYGIRIQLVGLLNIYLNDKQTALHMNFSDNPQYTTWKNEQFEKNNNYEKIVNNVYGFFKGFRPLYYKSTYAEEYLCIKCKTANDLQDSQRKMFSFAKNKKYSEAINEAENLLKKYPGFAFLHNFISSIHDILGNTSKALFHYAKAEEINPFIHQVPPNLLDFYKKFIEA